MKQLIRSSPDTRKLYKCISFAAKYWPYIAEEQKIRFATIQELLSGNDKQEFDHRWESESPAFQYMAEAMQSSYDRLYQKTVILSLGQSPNRRCWDEYCASGGVRYEFDLDLSVAKDSEIDFKDVIYDDTKIFNLASFMLSQQIDGNMKAMFQSKSQMSSQGGKALLAWLKGDEPRNLIVKHASNEIPFKKTTNFKFEDEFRFVHILEQEGPKPLKTILNQQKVELSIVGLRLNRISTSDVEKVKQRLPKCPVEIGGVNFG